MKSELHIRNWDAGKLILDPTRKKIIDLCRSRALSIKDLSALLDLNPGSVHNHIHRLADAGFLKIESTREINGIVEKRYRRTAKYFRAFKVKPSDTARRNKDIAKAASKSMVRVMEGKVHNLYLLNARVDRKTADKVTKLAEQVRSLLVESDGKGDVELEAVVCVGTVFPKKRKAK